VKKEKINPRSTHAARLTNNPKTNIVVTVVGSVPVPIGRPRVPGIVVPRATTQHTIPSISQALKTRTDINPNTFHERSIAICRRDRKTPKKIRAPG
jgi:hypothetical protein